MYLEAGVLAFYGRDSERHWLIRCVEMLISFVFWLVTGQLSAALRCRTFGLSSF